MLTGEGGAAEAAGVVVSCMVQRYVWVSERHGRPRWDTLHDMLRSYSVPLRSGRGENVEWSDVHPSVMDEITGILSGAKPLRATGCVHFGSEDDLRIAPRRWRSWTRLGVHRHASNVYLGKRATVRRFRTGARIFAVVDGDDWIIPPTE